MAQPNGGREQKLNRVGAVGARKDYLRMSGAMDRETSDVISKPTTSGSTVLKQGQRSEALLIGCLN